MKLALLIAGYLRSFENNIENFISNIIKENDCDIYIHVTENEKNDKYLNKKTSLELLKQKLNIKIKIFSNNFHFSKIDKINNIMNQNYKFYWLNEERKKIEKIENIKYDIIMKIRPDVYLNQDICFNQIEKDSIYIPIDSKIDSKKLKSYNDPYICDIIAYGIPKLMDHYFDFYLHLNEYIEKYGAVNETLLYYYLNNNTISYHLISIDYIVILSLCNTIAITGDSGSGKTTLSKILTNLFNNSFILECDRYHKWERGDENWNKITHLNPQANYITKMNDDVFDLKLGNNIYQVDYDHKTGKFTDKQFIESKENIIVCGLHTLYLNDNIINLKIFMDTHDNLRIPWKIKRDIKKRGYSIEKIMNQIQDRKEDYNNFIYPQKEKADIIICFYTDKVFDINTFDLNDNLNVYLKIGIHKKYNLNNFISKLKFDQIEEEYNFIYLYFNDIGDYEKNISIIILNL
jgi:uridine kinase